MNLFESLVLEALTHQPKFAPLRVVVEKELLHHDILRILSEHGLLTQLTFIGGTCLRICYGGVRLSEDLDFTGGRDFSRELLSSMGTVLKSSLFEKYGLQIEVSEPTKEFNNVDTWKIKVITRPQEKHSPMQRINIDICAVNSYDKRPSMIRNPYGVDMGTSGLILQAQSQEEIYTDKILAFALRPNRIKHRDLWDIAWLHQQGIQVNYDLIEPKLSERNIQYNDFLTAYITRQEMLFKQASIQVDFKEEMQRFLPQEQLAQTNSKDQLWRAIALLMQDHRNKLEQFFK